MEFDYRCQNHLEKHADRQLRLGMRSGSRYDRYRAWHERAPQLTAEQFNKRLKWFAGLGGCAGAGCAVWYLVGYYRRRLD